MGSTGECNLACQKLLLCSGCAGFGLRVQSEAQHLWVAQGHCFSHGFNQRQEARIVKIRLNVNEIFAKIGYPLVDHSTLRELGDDLIKISKVRGLPDADTRYCIERADKCEELIEANQTDYLQEIGYSGEL